MNRSTTLLLAGAAVGALAGGAATYLALPGRAETTGVSPPRASGDAAEAPAPPSRAPAAPPSRTSTPAYERGDPSDRSPISTSARAAIYEYAASAAPDDLEWMIQSASALPFSHRRRFELDALLMRLAEIDAGRAVRFARSLRLETELMVPLFQTWAQRDPPAALAELRAADNPAAVRTIALSLLDVFGDDENGVERLSSVLSGSQMQSFRVEAVARLAGRDPLGALRRALSLRESTSRLAAVSRVATEWAKHDPAAAMAQLAVLSDAEARGVYQAAVLGEWARIDPDAAFAHLRSTDAGEWSMPVGVDALQGLASADPEGLLALADALPAAMRTSARVAALRALAERDPLSAIATLESVEDTRDRGQLRAAVAGAYARRDPVQALEWARSLRPASGEVVASVLSSIAATDPDLAVELYAENETSPFGPIPSLAAMNAFGAVPDSDRVAVIADRLLAMNQSDTSRNIQMLVASWSVRDPNAALDWVAANADLAGSSALSAVAVELAAQDPDAAIRAMDRLPADLHDEWLAQVAEGYAEYDPSASAEWIVQYQGQPGFDTAVAAIARRSARSDPATAVRLFDRVGRPIEPDIAAQVGWSWAERDPRAASEWAMRITDTQARFGAVEGVASRWSGRDPDGARRWALSLPAGAMRDQALGPVLAGTQRDGKIDAGLLEAFSDDAARQNAVLRVLPLVARRDPAEARALLDTYVTDPATRKRALETIEGIAP